MQTPQRKKFIIGLFTGLIVGGITIMMIPVLLVLAYLLDVEDSHSQTTDISYYSEMIQDTEHLQTGFLSFPEEIPDSAEGVEYYYYCKDLWDDPECEVFLQCTYSQEDYEAEVQRLEHAKKVYGDEGRYLLRDEKGVFDYPAYIAIEKMDYCYEYALLTGENQITYVYLSFMAEEELHMDKKYLPSDYEKADVSKAELELLEGYSVYLKEVNYWRGEIDSWEYEYTRN